ncbi:hypothetical protein AGR6A_Cc60326 [Agrobacterium sp. NCPPB 925]|nr:hypothetical protein AGR6A_Cc60326 [Agrobacterium sp. NCPPB 925]
MNISASSCWKAIMTGLLKAKKNPAMMPRVNGANRRKTRHAGSLAISSAGKCLVVMSFRNELDMKISIEYPYAIVRIFRTYMYGFCQGSVDAKREQRNTSA